MTIKFSMANSFISQHSGIENCGKLRRKQSEIMGKCLFLTLVWLFSFLCCRFSLIMERFEVGGLKLMVVCLVALFWELLRLRFNLLRIFKGFVRGWGPLCSTYTAILLKKNYFIWKFVKNKQKFGRKKPFPSFLLF